MNKPKDGGTAFPVPAQSHYSGMSLRDWFAGQALVVWLSNPTSRMPTGDGADTLARTAYGVADAMLAHRNGESSS